MRRSDGPDAWVLRRAYRRFKRIPWIGPPTAWMLSSARHGTQRWTRNRFAACQEWLWAKAPVRRARVRRDLVVRRRIHLVREGGMGDVLMCTPVLREIERRHPATEVWFYTRYESIVRDLGCVDRVLPIEAAPRGAHALVYEHAIPTDRHLASVMGEWLGIATPPAAPECRVDGVAVARWRALANERPLVVVQRWASGYTPNKDWPETSWNALVASLAADCTVLEVGTQTRPGDVTPVRGYHDLRGRTAIADLFAVIAAADAIVAPVSGPIHVAAGLGVPGVAILGGYESPSCTAYPGIRHLGSDIPCAPCWLNAPCPIGRACLAGIAPETVEAHVREILSEARRNREASRRGIVDDGAHRQADDVGPGEGAPDPAS